MCCVSLCVPECVCAHVYICIVFFVFLYLYCICIVFVLCFYLVWKDGGDKEDQDLLIFRVGRMPEEGRDGADARKLAVEI